MEKETFFHDKLSGMDVNDLRSMNIVHFHLAMEDAFHGTKRLDMVRRNNACEKETPITFVKYDPNHVEWAWHHSRIYHQCLEEIHRDYDEICTGLKKKYNLTVK